MKRFDLHVHTSESSECGRVGARELVDCYRKTGYDGVVITDHCIPRYVKKFSSVEEMLMKQREGYFNARDYGDKVGFHVYYGCEFRFSEALQTDFLVYGAEPDYFLERPDLMYAPLVDGLKQMRGDGLLVYQAHPFRNQMQITDPALLDGIEVYNGHVGYDSRNAFAMLWAENEHLNKISGSDFHHLCDKARGGILCGDSVTTYDDLLKVLRTNEYQLVISNS